MAAPSTLLYKSLSGLRTYAKTYDGKLSGLMSTVNLIKEQAQSLNINQANNAEYVVKGMLGNVPYGNIYINIVDAAPAAATASANVLYLVKA